MKKLVVLLLTSALLFTLFAGVSASAENITVSVSSRVAKPNEAVAISVSAPGAEQGKLYIESTPIPFFGDSMSFSTFLSEGKLTFYAVACYNCIWSDEKSNEVTVYWTNDPSSVPQEADDSSLMAEEPEWLQYVNNQIGPKSQEEVVSNEEVLKRYDIKHIDADIYNPFWAEQSKANTDFLKSANSYKAVEIPYTGFSVILPESNTRSWQLSAEQPAFKWGELVFQTYPLDVADGTYIPERTIYAQVNEGNYERAITRALNGGFTLDSFRVVTLNGVENCLLMVYGEMGINVSVAMAVPLDKLVNVDSAISEQAAEKGAYLVLIIEDPTMEVINGQFESYIYELEPILYTIMPTSAANEIAASLPLA